MSMNRRYTQRNRRGHRVMLDPGTTLVPRPDCAVKATQNRETARQYLTPLAELDLAIRNGWGDTPQLKLPADWRTRRNPRGRVELV